ncbi:hypothetical protein GCM10027168_21050 [Streptomyces capparidis]
MPESESTETETNCFGCAPRNPIGLRLTFERYEDGFATRFRLGENYESFPGVIHGGIVASILDEVLAQTVYRLGRVSAFTTGLRVRYGRPMETGAEYVAHARITARDGASVRASGRIELPGGGLVAAADGTFHRLTEGALGQYGERLPAGLVRALRAANGPEGAQETTPAQTTGG